MPQAMTFDAMPRTLRGDRPPSFGEQFRSAIANIPAKVLARAASVTPKAAEKWKAGDNAPSAEALLALAAEIDAVWAVVRRSSCRTEEHAEAILAEFQARLAQRRVG